MPARDICTSGSHIFDVLGSSTSSVVAPPLMITDEQIVEGYGIDGVLAEAGGRSSQAPGAGRKTQVMSLDDPRDRRG